MKGTIKISVIIPVYNAESYIKKMVESVLCQTLSDIEIICVNDGSTDGTARILSEISLADDRLRIINQINKGAGAARNRGLVEAGGEYLSFLDSDDFCEPDMLEKAYRAAEQNKADIVVFRSDRFNVSTGCYEEASWTIKDDKLPTSATFSHKNTQDIYMCFVGWAWDKLFSRECVERSGLLFQEQKSINDMYFVFGLLSVAESISVLNDVLIHKRTGNKGSITGNYGGLSGTKDLFSALKELKCFLSTQNIEDELRHDYVSCACYYLRWNLDKNIESEDFSGVFNETKKFIVEYIPDYVEAFSKIESINGKEKIRFIEEITNKSPDEFRWNEQLRRKNGDYLFPFELVPKESKIILYGAGKVGKTFYRQVMFSGWCDIVSWVDKNDERFEVSNPQIISKEKYDYIVIAISNEKSANQIKRQLLLDGVKSEKLIWKNYEIELSRNSEVL